VSKFFLLCVFHASYYEVQAKVFCVSLVQCIVCYDNIILILNLKSKVKKGYKHYIIAKIFDKEINSPL
jgi:hypothetical protein